MNRFLQQGNLGTLQLEPMHFHAELESRFVSGGGFEGRFGQIHEGVAQPVFYALSIGSVAFSRYQSQMWYSSRLETMADIPA